MHFSAIQILFVTKVKIHVPAQNCGFPIVPQIAKMKDMPMPFHSGVLTGSYLSHVGASVGQLYD